MHMERIGNRIAALRRREGLSQAALAEQLNVSPQAVSKWGRGQNLPDLDALTLISHLFNISINGILEDEELFFFFSRKASHRDTIFVPSS